MYTKVAPIILNAGKSLGLSTVYISQPNAEQERLAGKVFLLAEIANKKSESEKILNFLINELELNYYDDKLLLLDKLDKLTIDNIFEATIGKINHNLEEYLIEQKIKLNLEALNITIGAIYKNKLYFSTYGNNRSLLIHRRQDGFEIINVENQASTESLSNPGNIIKPNKRKVNLFSSVINGSIPINSYFIFANESLPEYLSGRQLVEIITKIPPIVAAEQIKNELIKINNYVPFLGLIIKNTTGDQTQRIKIPNHGSVSSNKSMSSLNYTEEKTEKILAPVGLVSLRKIGSTFSLLIKKIKSISLPKIKLTSKRTKTRAQNEALIDAPLQTLEVEQLRIDSIQESRKATDIFDLKEGNAFAKLPKLSFKKGSRKFLSNSKKFIIAFKELFTKQFWKNLFNKIINWFKLSSKKVIFLLLAIIILISIFTVNIIQLKHKRLKEMALNEFQEVLDELRKKGDSIESSLLYNNLPAALKTLEEAESLSNAIKPNKYLGEEEYQEINESLTALKDKAKKITRVNVLEELREMDNFEASEIIVAKNHLFAASGNVLYRLNLEDPEKDEKIELSNTNGLSLRGGKFDGDNTIYYRTENTIHTLNLNNLKSSTYTLSSYNESENYAGFDLYNNTVYLLARGENNLFRYNSSGQGRSAWFNESVDLSSSIDIFIDGDIYILDKNGSVNKYRVGKKEEYSNSQLDPITNSSHKLLGDDQKLYILDENNKRLVVLNKPNGTLSGQYYFESLNKLEDFSLDLERGLIYLLADNKLYRWKL